MVGVTVNSGQFPLMRDVDLSRQPERNRVYTAWIRAFSDNVPDAVDHLADIIEDVYAFELWKDNYLDTPEQFFDRIGVLGLDLERPAKLIKELRKKRSSKKAEIIRRAEEVRKLREQGKTQQQIAESLGVSQPTVAADLSGNRVITPETDKPDKRKVVGYRITEYTKPKTAAQKIRSTFGNVFADKLREELAKCNT